MTSPRKPITILLAQDATHDQNLMRQVVQESHPLWRLDIVKDGEELLDSLHHRRQYSQWGIAPRPNLILLDWHLAKLNSSEVLQAIKADPNRRHIPIVVLTSSISEDDIRCSYEQGASSYLAKPMTFELLVEAVNALGEYWFYTVELPPGSTHE